ncbi:2-aminoethanethiol dioxygenase [Folsomia candida]|uniref:2-aminoethanethiol dioxygenase n=1 Tax=Folsomia candida TaxID=158441 RepID=A0A226E655_FOLCA|nr:2-aminoethanethiol dioxygenase [Folsomia candida]OXA52830.1 2-aminoethanethiol dioxygenase [Folsomia candida]
MSRMGSSALKSLVTQAYQVFRTQSKNLTPPNNQFPPQDTNSISPEIKSLTDMMHSISADTVCLHRLYTSKVAQRKLITFIEVVYNPVLTVVIIVIPSGLRLPIHDHPNMTGLIKVLHGQVRVSSYTKVGPTGEDGRQAALKTQDAVLSRLSYPQVLTPGLNNVHAVEFESGEGGKEYAAFLDVLSPPYDEKVGCHYYQCEEGQAKGQAGDAGEPCTLVEVDCPQEYQTHSLPFRQFQ